MGAMSDNQFYYDGKKYNLSIELYHPSVGTISLENSCVEMFSYKNEVNQLFLTGTIVYTDIFGKIDPFLDKMYSQCNAMFGLIVEKDRGDLHMEKLSNVRNFRHTFVIQNIEILERKNEKIKYKLTLVSMHAMKCLSNISYSTYGDQQEFVTDILKTCIQACGLKTDDKTFSDFKSNVKIDFISQRNDTLLSVQKYLLDKMYYFKDKDESMKFLSYYPLTDMTILFDLTMNQSLLGISPVTLSLYNSDKETLMSQNPVNLGTIVQMPFTETFQALYTHEFYDFDPKDNIFIDRSVKCEQLCKYINNRLEILNKKEEEKFIWPIASQLDFVQAGTYWNNDFNMYQQFVDSLLKNNSLIVNMSGDITRSPGSALAVGVDVETVPADGFDSKHDSLNDVKSRYKGLEGIWLTSRVNNIIEPNKSKYRQNVVLFRNYVNKFK